MHPFFTNIGSYLKTTVDAWTASDVSTAVNGTAVQLEGPGYSYKSAQIVAYVGPATGAPSGVSVTFQLQQSPDGTDTWTNYSDLQGNGLITVAAASTQAVQNVVLQGAQQYVRLVATPTLTGGTSPTVSFAGVIVAGGSSENPAV